VPYNNYQHHRQRGGAIVALLFLNYALVLACCFPPGTAMSSGILVAPAALQPCQADRLRLRFLSDKFAMPPQAIAGTRT
jgi:hypothetical protein